MLNVQDVIYNRSVRNFQLCQRMYTQNEENLVYLALSHFKVYIYSYFHILEPDHLIKLYCQARTFSNLCYYLKIRIIATISLQALLHS